MKEIQKAVIKDGDKYLVLLRSPQANYFPLCWDFPGGKLELNEDKFSGIAREVKEETNLDIKPTNVVGIYELDLDKKGEMTHRITVYNTENRDSSFKNVELSPEHLEYKWAIKEEILKLPRETYLDLFFEDNS